MRIFFIGSVDFSRSMLETLLEIPEAEIVGIATKSSSQFNADHTDLSDLAIQNEIPYKYVRDINQPHIIEWISGLKPEVIFTFGWSSLIKKELLELAPHGVIGYHPAELPMNRGRHPLIWALVLGLSHTGSSFFRMDEGADSGDLLSQERIKIESSDTASTLYEKLTTVAKRQLRTFVPLMHRNEYQLQNQDHQKANYWRKRGKKDGEIDFRMTSNAIHNLVRAITHPYVGAHLVYKDSEYKVWSTQVSSEVPSNNEYGKVLGINSDGWILVKTGDGSIWITEHEIATQPIIGDYMI